MQDLMTMITTLRRPRSFSPHPSRSRSTRRSATRHPIAKRELSEGERVDLDGAWLSCGGWFLIEAIEALAEGAQADD